ncbi:MAG: hypothetical protein QM775_33050 [Pirellulales bacterium]
MVARRQDRVLHGAGDDRKLFARTRRQVAGKLRPQEALGLRRSVHARTADQEEGAATDTVLAAGRLPRQTGRLRRRPEARANRGCGRQSDQDVRRRAEFRQLLPSRREADVRRSRVCESREAPGAVELLEKYRTQLATVEPFETARLEAFSQEFITAEGKKIGELVHPLRVALTGQGVGLGLFDTLAILGRESSLRRIELAIGRAS